MIEPLVDRYIDIGLAVAGRIVGDDVLPARVLDAVLDAVHDAFVTAFDEAVSGDARCLGPVFNELMTSFANALGEAPARWSDARDGATAIRSADSVQLRRDMISDVRLTIDLGIGAPRRPWHRMAARVIRYIGDRYQLALPSRPPDLDARIVVR